MHHRSLTVNSVYQEWICRKENFHQEKGSRIQDFNDLALKYKVAIPAA